MVKKPLVSKELMSILACPVCKGDLKLVGKKLVCQSKKCGNEYPIKDGIPILLPPELRD